MMISRATARWTTTRMQVASLILSVISCGASGASLSPEQEYTLQAHVLLQDDAEARQVLRTQHGHAEPSQAIDWQPIIEDVPAWLSRQAFPTPAVTTTVTFAEALAARLTRVRCTALDFTPLGSPEIGLYRLVCQLPDIEPLRSDYLAMHAAPDSERLARVDALFLRWASLLRNAPDVARCTPVISRYQARSGSEHAQRAQQLYQTILGRLLPFDSWLGAPLSEGAEEICDP
ncbi:TPA: hypothetical protein ACOFCQ_002287 [Stenotrophomonas maltophilia]